MNRVALLDSAELWANNYDVTREALLYIIDHHTSEGSNEDSEVSGHGGRSCS